MQAIRRIQFCAGHRIYGHESKCRHPHGHNYVAFFHAQAIPGLSELDKLGRVVDFGTIKRFMGGWIDHNWDHKFIFWKEDGPLVSMFTPEESFQLPYNPTAENMARYLLEEVCPGEFRTTGIEIVKIVLWETENCYVEVTK